MPFYPRTKAEIFKSLIARVVAQSKLSDVAPGSVLTHVLGTVAHEIDRVEFRIKEVRDAFNFEKAAGTDLDDRLNDFPPGGMTRLPATGAFAECMKIQVTHTGNPIIVPAGTIYAKSDDETFQYFQTGDVTVPKGNVGTTEWYPASAPFIAVKSSIPGTESNALAGEIDLVVSAGPDVIGCTNPTVCGGGANPESDESFKGRARDYLGSLSRITAAALRYVAKSFISTPATPNAPSFIFRHVVVYEPAEVPGYCELIVDPGSGGFDKSAEKNPAAKAKSAFVTQGSSRTYAWDHSTMHPPILYHDAPATDPLSDRHVVLKFRANGDWLPLDHKHVKEYYQIPKEVDPVISIPERGLLYLDPKYKITSTPYSSAKAGKLPPIKSGVKIKIGATKNGALPYHVFTGPIAEMQALIEGNPNDPINFPGYRPAGTRVRVTLPFVTYINEINVDIVASPSGLNDLASLEKVVIDSILFVVNELAPGETLRLAEIICAVLELDGVFNVTMVTPIVDVSPDKETHVLRIASKNIKVS